jgi:hypothetical protein
MNMREINEIIVFNKEQALFEISRLNLIFNNFIKENEYKPVVKPLTLNLNKINYSMSYEALQNTLAYCIDKLKLKCQLIIIESGYVHTIIHIIPQDSPKEYLPRLKNLNKKLHWPQSFKDKKDNSMFTVNSETYKREDLRFMGCVVTPISHSKNILPGSVPPPEDKSKFGEMIRQASELGKLPDGTYLLSASDILVLRNDKKEPWIAVVGGLKDIPKKDNISENFIPILNLHSALSYCDIPLPNYDDWAYSRAVRKSSELEIKNWDMDDSDLTLNWSQKINKAIFRGTATGCGFTYNSNMRLKASELSKKYSNILDAGITGNQPKLKLHSIDGVGYVKPIKFIQKIPFSEQSKYKYILHLDGNVAAYRLGKSLLFNSVVLLQETGSRLWFQHLLKPWEHYVPIKEDLSDLIEKINWCIHHDKECQAIANNGRALAKTFLTKDECLKYIYEMMWSIM